LASNKFWFLPLVINFAILDSLLTQESVHILKMTLAEQEKIDAYRKNIAEALQILDEIIAIIRFQDNPEDTIIDQKLEGIKKILNQ
jgi:hypothetical protein